MSRQAKILIFAAILVYSIFSYQSNNSILSWLDDIRKETNRKSNQNFERLKKENEQKRKSNNTSPKATENKTVEYFPQPKNGFSPYDNFFGKGVYNNSTRNSFKIENSNSSDAIVLLVNAYTGKKIRNEYIRKGATFKMTGVPNGTYYLEWTSGNNWSPNLAIGNLIGGFQTDARYTKTRDQNDWMRVTGGDEWTVTLYTVSGGDVESESLSEFEFGN